MPLAPFSPSLPASHVPLADSWALKEECGSKRIGARDCARLGGGWREEEEEEEG